MDCLLISALLFIVAQRSCGCWLGGSLGLDLSGSFGAREEHLSICSPFQDDPDVSATGSDLHLRLVPGSLLQFFREKREVVLGGSLPFEFPLEIEITLYNSFIS